MINGYSQLGMECAVDVVVNTVQQVLLPGDRDLVSDVDIMSRIDELPPETLDDIMLQVYQRLSDEGKELLIEACRNQLEQGP